MALYLLLDAAGAVVVIDRLTPREAAKRNHALAAMRYAYRWEPAEDHAG